MEAAVGRAPGQSSLLDSCRRLRLGYTAPQARSTEIACCQRLKYLQLLGSLGCNLQSHQQNRDPGSSWLGDLSQSRPGLSCSYCTAASSNPHPSCRAPGPSSWPPAVLPCSSSEQHTPWVAAAAAACSFLNSDECLATNHVSLVTTPMGLHRQQVEMPVLYWNVERRSTIHRNTQVHACTGVYRRVPVFLLWSRGPSWGAQGLQWLYERWPTCDS